ncbi:MAG: hypothetical protein I8H81_10570 [Pseudomonadales bacterium]|nr:hypothetical protein [Pseudomonadales bacterium]MBH2037703.1 hypothetical protein [Pseudomonadales bacterium]MBH2075990.1 hypothetical protein [Pseudomonadales bacterium]
MIDLTFISGSITHDDLSPLEDSNLEYQIESLKEDLLQVEYPASLLLDVGWYPSFNLAGCFQIRVIESYNWETPLFLSTSKTIPSLIEELSIAQIFVEKHQKI